MLQWVIEQSCNAIESGIGLGGAAALLTDEDTRFAALIRTLLVEHRAALAAVVEDAAAAGQLRADLDVDTMLDCIVGAYLADEHAAENVRPGFRNEFFAHYGQLSPPPHKSHTTSRAAQVARPFSIAHGRMHIFHRTPATRLAIGPLWQDLEARGFLEDTAPQNI